MPMWSTKLFITVCFSGSGDLLRKYEGKVKVLANFGKAADKEDDVSPDSIREQCDLILNALGLKTIDVFYQASKDPDASIATVMLELKVGNALLFFKV